VTRLGPYSQAVRVGDLVFTAGQSGIDPSTGHLAGATFEAQSRQAFANLRAVLEDAGSRLERVVKVTCFIADAGAFGTLNALFEEFFPASPPVRSDAHRVGSGIACRARAPTTPNNTSVRTNDTSIPRS